MYSNYKSIVFRILLCFFLLCMTVGCRKEKNAYGYYYINESDEIVSPFYDYDYDIPSPFYDKNIARIEKKENALDEERDVYFIDREFNIIGDSFF
ncbi:hypothetical protein D6853_10295 [Butyrivibrio sp. X503]|uniref:hypothetical protein n=1 Tax=Butyrivibrio sp. X503 TaxID=2364878 RepID=UPI000EAA4A9B|nr:hypothetical protein [Butyrivibrio sp. X503]RKM55119.1 hypothetical protein D6853_10295 [Butyrivibrio sp. X503]